MSNRGFFDNDPYRSPRELGVSARNQPSRLRRAAIYLYLSPAGLIPALVAIALLWPELQRTVSNNDGVDVALFIVVGYCICVVAWFCGSLMLWIDKWRVYVSGTLLILFGALMLPILFFLVVIVMTLSARGVF